MNYHRDHRLYVSSRRGEKTIGWDALPEVGVDRRFRARAWRLVLAALLVFWSAVAFVAVAIAR